jgi:hypothetical protein
MKRNDEWKEPEVGQRHLDEVEDATDDHVVFDFTGLEEPDICDLSLILTARLQSPLTDSVWVRSLPWETARTLRILGLDHLFRQYPTPAEELN